MSKIDTVTVTLNEYLNLYEASKDSRSLQVEYDNACEFITELESIIIEYHVEDNYGLRFDNDTTLQEFMNLGEEGSCLTLEEVNYLKQLGIEENLILRVCEAFWHNNCEKNRNKYSDAETHRIG